MSNRLTNVDKWNDVWFSNLSPHAKLLFIFLCENCDNAGVYETNKKFMLFYLGINEEELRKAIEEIRKIYVKSNDGNRIWIRNYLRHQKKLPLNDNNNNHKQIILILKDNLSDESKFKGCKEMSSILPESLKVVTKRIYNRVLQDPENSESKTRVKFSKPTVQDVTDFMKEKEFSMAETEAVRFINYFESNGWKVGKNPMSNWKGAVNNWIENWKIRNDKQVVKTKLDKVKEAHENLDNIDWSAKYNS
jgi:hypothetical protein